MTSIKKAYLSLFNSSQEPLLNQVIPFELQVVGGMTIIERVINGLVENGVEEIVVSGPTYKKSVEDYLKLLQDHEEQYEDVDFQFIFSKKENLLKAQPYLDDNFYYYPSYLMVVGKKSVFEQMAKMFRTAEQCVAGLQEGLKEVSVDKIARHLYKIQDIKSSDKEGFAFLNCFVLIPEIFKYLKKDTDLYDGLNTIIQQGENVYGSQIRGQFFDVSKTAGLSMAQKYYLSE